MDNNWLGAVNEAIVLLKNVCEYYYRDNAVECCAKCPLIYNCGKAVQDWEQLG